MVTIQSAESNRAVLRYIPELAWGEIPANGKVKTMRITSSSLVASKETATSEEIRADRMVSAVIETAASSSGDTDFEASAGSQDDFWEHFMLSAWSTPMNFLLTKGSVAITDTDEVSIIGVDFTDWLSDNQWLKLEGFLTPGNNRYVSVAGTPTFTGGNTVITIDQTVVVEASSAYTKLMDAGDVLAVATTISFGAANTVDGGGANAFGTLKPGQKVHLFGLGIGSGTLTAIATDPTEGDKFTVNDGVQSLTFEIRTNPSLVTPGNVHVAFSGTEATLAANIGAAINDQFRQKNIQCSATVATAVVTVRNLRGAGGSLTEASTGLTAVDFTGGSATKNGFFTVASVIDNDTFTTVETLGTDANSGTRTVVVKGSHLRNPGDPNDIVKKSFSVETGFTDVGKQFTHDGMRTGTISMDVSAGEIVTGTVSFMGRETKPRNSTVLGDTGTYDVLDSTATEVWNATANVGAIKKDGITLTKALSAISFEADANLREQRAIGNKFPAGIGYGRFSLTGSVTAYFEDYTFYNAFINHETTSLSFPFTDADFNTYYFTFPALKFTSDPVSPGGIDEDIMEEMEFTAFRDATLKTMMMIDRFSSVYPPSAA